ncbi:MAG: ECF transporter S component [Clostridia bacterium]|nr:ECF transporter S component [Clostridia bacterium]
MLDTKKMVFTAMLIALGVVLPVAFHSVPDAGRVFLPMHIPVLLCGILCGFPYGLVCGIITPLLSSLVNGRPQGAMLPSMLCELAAYGGVAALLMHLVRTKNTYVRIYASLVGAMLAGRIVYGIVNAVLFRMGDYSLQGWMTSSFVTALPGIAIQLVLIPALLFAFERAGIMRLRD